VCTEARRDAQRDEGHRMKFDACACAEVGSRGCAQVRGVGDAGAAAEAEPRTREGGEEWVVADFGVEAGEGGHIWGGWAEARRRRRVLRTCRVYTASTGATR